MTNILQFKMNLLKLYSLRLVEEKVNDIVSALGVVEEDEEGPVNEPCPLLERLERRAHRLEETRREHSHKMNRKK